MKLRRYEASSGKVSSTKQMSMRESIDSLLKINEERKLIREQNEAPTTPKGSNFLKFLESSVSSLFGGLGGMGSSGPIGNAITEENSGSADDSFDEENNGIEEERKTKQAPLVSTSYSQRKVPSLIGRNPSPRQQQRPPL
jgi:hypothetical protein